MTTVDVSYKYGIPPGEQELRAINAAREVYGVRKVQFDEKAQSVTVEYDASRLLESDIANMLRRAGLDITGRMARA
jgi:hypothetical protein